MLVRLLNDNTKEGWTPLHLPLADMSCIFKASEEDVLVRLLNEHTKEGLTPLHLACNKEKQDIVVTLLCSGKGNKINIL